jgi:DeoR/GlpR family transcriptional regulator of sugar metabolism
VFVLSVKEEAVAQSIKSRPERPLAVARRAQIVDLLRQSGSITVAEVEARFGVSSMTARRDLEHLERKGRARRTHGGAVLPEITAHEDSFVSRLERDAGPKHALADAAVELLQPHESVFLDSSSTTYVLAERIVRRGIPLTVITNSLPIMQLVGTQQSDNLTLIGVGGMLRRLTRSYVGPLAVQSVSSHFADRLFLSIKGLTADGVMTDAEPLEAEVKRAMIAHADEPVLLIDHTKLATRGLSAIDSITTLARVVVHGVEQGELATLRARGVDVLLAQEAA